MCQRAVLHVQASENGTGPVDPFQREVFNLLGYGAPQKQTLSPVVYPFVQDFVWQVCGVWLCVCVCVATYHIGPLTDPDRPCASSLRNWCLC